MNNLEWAYRFRSGSIVFVAENRKDWKTIYRMARLMRNGFQTFVFWDGEWRSVL